MLELSVKPTVVVGDGSILKQFMKNTCEDLEDEYDNGQAKEDDECTKKYMTTVSSDEFDQELLAEVMYPQAFVYYTGKITGDKKWNKQLVPVKNFKPDFSNIDD
jgi:hypothetical protein